MDGSAACPAEVASSIPLLLKTPFAEKLFYEAIEEDKKIAAAHFADAEVGGAMLAVDPGIVENNLFEVM
jgi:hypothetical protein